MAIHQSTDRSLRPFKAIAAMAQNRVIGSGNRLPWHIPEDFQWFKRRTMGQVLLMGRKTFESIGRPLPGRETIVLSRTLAATPGIRVIPDAGSIDWRTEDREVFLCGGAQLYEQLLDRCSDLYLTLVHREVDGDAFFPRFEPGFEPSECLLNTSAFSIWHYRRRD